MGGKGGGGLSLKSDMQGMGHKGMQSKAFGRSGGKGIKGSQLGKGKAKQAARKSV
jgi:hypothetical protein